MKNWLFGIALGLTLVATASAQSADEREQDIMFAAHDAMSEQVDVWFHGTDFPRCIQLLYFQYEIDQHDYELATNLGWLLESTDRHNEALAIYIRYRKDNLTDPDAALPEAQYYFMRKAYAKVPPLVEPALAKNPHPNMYRILAHSYEKMGMLGDCLRIWNKYLALNPSDLAAKKNRDRVKQKLEAA
ncbi:MAG: hypothetical protein J0L72_02590 [Armatimonadetes bacterium]|nr:hypothetical protein [Armatimonadota bacterium]